MTEFDMDRWNDDGGQLITRECEDEAPQEEDTNGETIDLI
jgi:hypothetical protein